MGHIAAPSDAVTRYTGRHLLAVGEVARLDDHGDACYDVSHLCSGVEVPAVISEWDLTACSADDLEVWCASEGACPACVTAYRKGAA